MTTTVIKTPGQYRVLIPRIGRQRQDRYVDVFSASEQDAIEDVERVLDRDPRYAGFWYDLRVIKTFVEPVVETVEERDARSARARERARAARVRARDRGILKDRERYQ